MDEPKESGPAEAPEMSAAAAGARESNGTGAKDARSASTGPLEAAAARSPLPVRPRRAGGGEPLAAPVASPDVLAPQATATEALPGAVAAAQPAPLEPEPAVVEGGPAEAPAPAASRPAWKVVLSYLIGSRWLLAIPAVLIAVYTSAWVEDSRIGLNRIGMPPQDSYKWFAVAGALLVLAAFPPINLLPSGPSNFLSNFRASRRKGAFFALLAGAIVSAGASVPLFMALNGAKEPADLDNAQRSWLINNGSWALYVLSIVLFGLAWIVWERTSAPPAEGVNPNPPADRLPRWLHLVLMLGIAGVATYLRVVNLDNVPPGFWFDEAQNGVVGRNLLSPGSLHVTFVGDFTQMGALYFYLVGFVNKFAGNVIWAVRIIPALSGALVCLMLYVLGNRLYGWRVGLAAGSLLAVSAWNITFSRLGMASMFTVMLDVAVFLFVAQGLRTGRLGYYAAAGVILGMALQQYYVSRLVPLILLVVLAHSLIFQNIRLVRAVRTGLIVFALGLVIGFLPVGLFALQRPDLYSGRTDTVSIFNPANNGGNLQQAIQDNIQRHLLMFNWLGDGNGRHNLPGTPQLDWITAAFFFAGLAACVLRFWRWQYIFPVAWFVAEMSGGVLTLPFEAPQSHRALEAAAACALMAGIFLGEAWTVLSGARMVERIVNGFNFVSGRVVRRRYAMTWPMRGAWALGIATLLLIFVWAGGLNVDKYFNVQARDMGVWKDMYAPQAHAARVSIRYGPDHDIYMAPILKGLPPSVYLAPDVQTTDWPGMQAIPLSGSKPGGAVIILDLPSAADVGMIARVYPNAQFELYTAPTNPEVLIYTITIPAKDIEDARGVQASLLDAGASGQRANPIIAGVTNDAAELGVSGGTVRLTSSLKVDMWGTYKFDWDRPSSGELDVDGYTVKAGEAISLATGLHSMVVTDTVKSSDAASHLLWTPPGGAPQVVPAANLFNPARVDAHGLTGTYRPGVNDQGPIQNLRIDPFISFSFHITPLPRPYQAVWEGALYVPEDGVYTLGTEQLSSSELYLDGQLVIQNVAVNAYMEHRAPLKQGFHAIRIAFKDMENYSHMYLYWTPPGRPRSIIPSAFLWPKMASYPTSPPLGKWPTLAESNGTDLPPDRVTYAPARVEGESAPRAPEPISLPFQPQPGQPQQQQPEQQQSQQPPPADTGPALKGELIKPLSTLGASGDTLNRPRAAAVDSNGAIYIFTEKDSRLHKFGSDGKPVKQWNVTGKDGQPVTEGSGVIVLGNKVYVLDSATSDLLGFTLDGDPQPSIHLCTCFFPRAIAPARDGNIWLANTGGSAVLKVSPEGKQIATFGEHGSQPGQFADPAGVWEAEDGTIFVADVGNRRVQSFSKDFKPLQEWPIGASIARDGDRLTGDSKGNILVTQLEGTAVVLYNRDGKEQNRWVYRLNGAPQVPAGIAPAGNDRFILLYPDANIALVFSTR